MSITCRDEIECDVGDQVYLIGRQQDSAGFAGMRETGIPPLSYKERFPSAKKVLHEYAPEKEPQKHRDRLWFKVDSPEWLDLLQNTPCQKLVYACEIDSIAALIGNPEQFRVWRSRLLFSLPPFIAEDVIPEWRKIIARGYGRSQIVGVLEYRPTCSFCKRET